MSRTKSTSSTTEKTSETETTTDETQVNVAEKTETESETETKAVQAETPTMGNSTMANTTGKMGVMRYLQKYPQSTYVATLLKTLYPKAIMTKSEWDQAVEDLLNTKINN